MTLLEVLNKIYAEETLPINKETGRMKRGILLLDVDDTLLQARDIFIWRKLPTDKTEVKLTPQQYADEHTTPETKKYYDYREFRDPVKVENSIEKGLPYINNLKVMDDFINGGYKIGILTARGMEDIVYSALKKFLKYRTPVGDLKAAPLNRKYVFAVNDDFKNYSGKTDYEKKKNVINKIRRYFDYVYFMDDDIKNLKAIKQLKQELPEKQANKIRTITAKKPDNIEEGVLNEMAVKDLEDENLVKLVNSGNLKEAGLYYIKKIIEENPARYKGLDWIESAKKILSYGIGKTVRTAVKKGSITQDYADKLIKAVETAAANEPEEEKQKRLAPPKAEIEFNDNNDIPEVKRDSRFKNYDLAIERIKKEKKRISDVKRTMLLRFLEQSDKFSLKTKEANETIEDISSNIEWIMKSLIPPFIQEQQLSKDAKERIEKIGDKELLKKRATIAKEYIELYNKFLNKVIAEYEVISQDEDLSDDEKINKLSSDKRFRNVFDKIANVIKKRDEENKDKKVLNKVLKAANRSDDDNKSVTSIMQEYYKSLNDLETAYKEDRLKEYVKENFNKIKNMLVTSSEAVDAKAVKYNPPKEFNREPIQEDLDYSKIGSLVGKFAKEREKSDYSYSGIERDSPELKYIFDYANKDVGNEKKVFKIIANIYLDFIDGVNVVISSKNKGLLKASDGDKKIEQIVSKKETASKLKTGGVKELNDKEINDTLDLSINKVIDQELKDRISLAISVLNLNNKDEDFKQELLRNSKRGPIEFFNYLKEIPEITNNIVGDKAKKLLKNVIGRFSVADRFNHKIAVNINFNGNRYSQEELNELANAAFIDPTNKELYKKLKEPKFSTRKTN